MLNRDQTRSASLVLGIATAFPVYGAESNRGAEPACEVVIRSREPVRGSCCSFSLLESGVTEIGAAAAIQCAQGGARWPQDRAQKTP